jgi:hypothetical protein
MDRLDDNFGLVEVLTLGKSTSFIRNIKPQFLAGGAAITLNRLKLYCIISGKALSLKLVHDFTWKPNNRSDD